MRQKGLQKILDRETRVLILGSFPGEESLIRGEYYANPTNDFWKLIGAVQNENFEKLTYSEKIRRLGDYGIGLWDVLYSCLRSGSGDGNIAEAEPNDFSTLKDDTPNLRLVCLNGKKAGKYEHLFRPLGIPTKVLLSSSGANRRHSSKRITQWRDALTSIE